jgi:hypothetical protein
VPFGSVLSIDTKWPFREIVPDVALKLRIEYAGAIYHVMNRGDRREPIFRDDGDRARFLETLGQACRGADWRVHAWCLMLNHSAPGDDDDITMDRGSVKGDIERSSIVDGGRPADNFGRREIRSFESLSVASNCNWRHSPLRQFCDNEATRVAGSAEHRYNALIFFGESFHRTY